MNHQDLANLRPEEIPVALAAVQAELAYRQKNLFETYFPDTGPYRRELYPRHMELFREGEEHRERLFMAANRVGKTQAGAYETVCHMTGRYPHWWEGKKFPGPVKCWIAGKDAKTTRDICQTELLGQWNHFGTGFLPAEALGGWRPKAGTPEAVDIFYVRHKPTGKWSRGQFKSYDQGDLSFQGTAQHFIWEDEEPPIKVHAECVLRTMTTDGIVLTTFTPLLGFSEMVKSFLEPTPEPDTAEEAEEIDDV
jgi:phage terminase large subunit-like protein